MKLELTIHRFDGTSEVMLVERDDNDGRRQVDRAAFAFIANPGVERVTVERVQRAAGYLKEK